MTAVSARSLFGPALLAATLASALIGVVGALSTSGSPFSSWLIAAASAALLLGPATLGISSEGAWRKPAFWLACGLGLSLGPLTVFGGLLKTATHHRPLGAATFAVIACALVVGSVLVCWRAGVLVERAEATRGRLIRSVVGAVALLSGAWALFALIKQAASSDFVFGFVQLAFALLTLWFASRRKTQDKLAGLPAFVGLGAWISLVLAGAILAATLDPQVASAPSTAILWLLFAP